MGDPRDALIPHEGAVPVIASLKPRLPYREKAREQVHADRAGGSAAWGRRADESAPESKVALQSVSRTVRLVRVPASFVGQ